MYKRFFPFCKRFLCTNFVQNENAFNTSVMKIILENKNHFNVIRENLLSSIELSRQINKNNVDAIAVNICTAMKEYDLAFAYLEYLHRENKTNLATIGKHFKLIHTKLTETKAKISEEDEEKIMSLLKYVRQRFPVLDALSLNNIIHAVSLTKHWSLCLDLLKEINIISSPTPGCYSVVVSAAFEHDSDKIAWEILEEILKNDKTPTEEIYTGFIRKLERTPENKIIDTLATMLLFLQQNNLRVTENTARKLADFLRSRNIKVDFLNFHKTGFCKNCKNKLRNFDLASTEFDELKAQVIKHVITGKDIFNKSTEIELDNFKTFIASIDGSYDVIVDGLNVAYSAGVDRSPTFTSGLVASVVQHFALKLRKKVLVLGRKHMEKWPKNNWQRITKHAKVFLTNDLSHDDPFLLYCALHSGRETIIVSRDLMRSHKFLLQNLHLKRLFDRWLVQRQWYLLHVDAHGVPNFRMPISYADLPQKNGDFWHVPYDPNIAVAKSNGFKKINTTWMCIGCK